MMTTVAIVISAYNEGPQFGADLVRFADYFAPYKRTYELSFVIVDDASTDETLILSRAFARYRHNVTVIAHERRFGLGRVLHNALLYIFAQYTIMLHGGVEFGSAAAAMELLETLESTGADVAVASASARPRRSFTAKARELCAALVHTMRSAFAGAGYARLGRSLHVYRTDFLKRLSFCGEGAEALTELLLEAIRAGGQIVERPTLLSRFAFPNEGYHS